MGYALYEFQLTDGSVDCCSDGDTERGDGTVGAGVGVEAAVALVDFLVSALTDSGIKLAPINMSITTNLMTLSLRAS